VIEGVNALTVALEAAAPVEAIYVAIDGLDDPGVGGVLDLAAHRGVRVFELARGVMERIADASSPQAVCGVGGFVDRPLAEVVAAAAESGNAHSAAAESGNAHSAAAESGNAHSAAADSGGAQIADAENGAGAGPASCSSLLLVCADIRDPGNLGALFRVADASGAGGVICCGTTVDPYNPKVVRASAGSMFNVPFAIEERVDEALAALAGAAYRRLATVAHGGADHLDTDLSGRLALIVGNEANGLGDELVEEMDGAVTIATVGRAESLNVAMAAAVLCFEAVRQRRLQLQG
jgi:TrmH family RNA methyltransferase